MLEKGKWILKIQTLLRPTINRADLKAETRKHQPFKFFLSEDRRRGGSVLPHLHPKYKSSKNILNTYDEEATLLFHSVLFGF